MKGDTKTPTQRCKLTQRDTIKPLKKCKTANPKHVHHLQRDAKCQQDKYKNNTKICRKTTRRSNNHFKGNRFKENQNAPNISTKTRVDSELLPRDATQHK